jgi:hypothetical protein
MTFFTVKPYKRVPGDSRGPEYEEGAVSIAFSNGPDVSLVVLTAEEANDLRMQLQEMWIAGKLR